MSTERFDALDELCTSQSVSISPSLVFNSTRTRMNQRRGTKSDDAYVPHPRSALRSQLFHHLKMKDTLFKLSQELNPPHQSDVKAVIPLPGNRIATASRDQSVGIWRFGEVSLHALVLVFGRLRVAYASRRPTNWKDC